MNAAVKLECENCDTLLSPAEERCSVCGKPNPHYTGTALRLIETAPKAPPSSEPRQSFEDVLKELSKAQKDQCKVIANVGMSVAGKSWLIARMGDLRGGVRRATLCSETKPPEPKIIKTGYRLARTSADQAYVWHLEPTQGTPGTRSGNWRIIDVAGELLADSGLDAAGKLAPNNGFIAKICGESRLHELLTMTLIHASALVVVLDGEKIADENQSGANPHACDVSVDEQNKTMLNELIRLMRFLQNHRDTIQAPTDVDPMPALRKRIRDTPNLDLGVDNKPLTIPTLLLISKADSLLQLVGKSPPPGIDPTRFAQQRLRQTYEMAMQNIRTLRWGFAAPFVEEGGKPPDPEVLNFKRPSFGVRQSLQWLDGELAGQRLDRSLTAQQAMRRVLRWWPFGVRGLPAA